MPNYLEPWDISKPAGSRDISLGDDDFREFKRAITERFGEDHEFQSDETGNSNIGYHKKVTLTKRSTDPDAVVDAGIFYTKDTGSGQMEAFFIDEAGNICQLTKRGQISKAGKFAEMYFGSIASIPSGYYICDGQGGRPDLRDKFVVGARQDDAGVCKTLVEGTLAQSGTPVHNHSGLTGSTTLTTSQIPSHSHTVTGSFANWTADTSSSRTGSRPDGAAPASSWSTDNAGGGLGHDHTISAVTAIPPYFALAFISQYNA